MSQIRGVYGAKDEVGAPYRNNIEDIRSMIWDLAGARQGVIRDFTMTLDAGSLSVTFAPGAAIIEERGVDINGDGRGYYVFNDEDTAVAFGAPSAGSRNDAVVFAWADPQYGNDIASYPSVDATGPQIVVVPGVSGSTTPRTDSEIDTAVGPGGWFRYADVVIAPTDTQVNPANVTLAAEAAPAANPPAWVDLTPTAATGWTVDTCRYLKTGSIVYLQVAATRSGATLTGGANGNIGDVDILTNIGLPADAKPESTTNLYMLVTRASVAFGTGALVPGASDRLVLGTLHTTATIDTGTAVQVQFSWPVTS